MKVHDGPRHNQPSAHRQNATSMVANGAFTEWAKKKIYTEFARESGTRTYEFPLDLALSVVHNKISTFCVLLPAQMEG